MTEVTTTKVVWYKNPKVRRAAKISGQIVGGVLLFVLAVCLVVAFVVPRVPSRVAAETQKPVERLAQPTEREMERMPDRKPAVVTIPTQEDQRLVEAIERGNRFANWVEQLVGAREKDANSMARLVSTNSDLSRSIIDLNSREAARASVDLDRDRLTAARAKEAEDLQRSRQQAADSEKKQAEQSELLQLRSENQALRRDRERMDAIAKTVYQALEGSVDSTSLKPVSGQAPAVPKPSRPRPEPSAYDHVVPPGAASKMFTPDDFMTKRIVPFSDNVDVTIFYKGGIINKQQMTIALPKPEQGSEGEGFKLDDYEGVHGVRFRSRDKGVPLRISQNPR